MQVWCNARQIQTKSFSFEQFTQHRCYTINQDVSTHGSSSAEQQFSSVVRSIVQLTMTQGLEMSWFIVWHLCCMNCSKKLFCSRMTHQWASTICKVAPLANLRPTTWMAENEESFLELTRTALFSIPPDLQRRVRGYLSASSLQWLRFSRWRSSSFRACTDIEWQNTRRHGTSLMRNVQWHLLELGGEVEVLLRRWWTSQWWTKGTIISLHKVNNVSNLIIRKWHYSIGQRG